MYEGEQISRSSPSSLETLEEIIRNYQRNEQRLHELRRHVRHERKKAERLLNETYQSQTLLHSKREPIEYFLAFENNQTTKPQRVRFNLPERNLDEQLDSLSHRCEDLLSALHLYRPRTTLFSPVPDNDQNITLQEALQLSRPDFICHSRQRLEHLHHPREERSGTYAEMKRSAKDKYDQLPEVNERLQKELFEEMKRRNYLRAKIFRHRLRQHVLLHGRTNIDESLTMMDT